MCFGPSSAEREAARRAQQQQAQAAAAQRAAAEAEARAEAERRAEAKASDISNALGGNNALKNMQGGAGRRRRHRRICRRFLGRFS